MLLQKLDIRSFRGMVNVLLDKLSPISIVVGANNSGKSTVLEAAALITRPFDPPQWVQVAKQRDFDLFIVDGLWSLFPSGVPLDVDDGPKQTKKLDIRGLLDSRSRELSATGLASAGWDLDEKEDLVLRIEAAVREENNGPFRHTMEFRKDDLARYSNEIQFYKSFTVTPATHRSTRNLVEHLSRAVDEGRKSIAIDLLRLFDSQVDDLDISASRGRDGVRVTHKLRGVVDLASFGDGMRRSAALALALVRSHNGLLLIDEIEAGIHPSILPRVLAQLIEAAEMANVQILATTHSLEAIDALITALADHPSAKASGYYLHRKEGKHAVRHYAHDDLIALRQAGLDLR
jgi:predicted ATPase